MVAEFGDKPRLVVLSGPYQYHNVPWRIRAATEMFYGLCYAADLFNKKCWASAAWCRAATSS